MSVITLNPPTLYEYYTNSGIKAGLSDNQPYFTLNDRNITIYSGAFHYFRVPRPYWRDRLRKMRAAGLNTVETVIPWNIHEPRSGVFEFGNGDSDLSDFLHLEEFLKTAQEEDLLALVRPGPYVCAEWEFGGFPSWLLRNVTAMRTSSDSNFLNYVKRYFNVLLPILALLQFQKGGPIIGFQIENEYSHFGISDPIYLEFLKTLFLKNGIIELLYTADTPGTGTSGSISGVLQTANIDYNIKENLDILKNRQPNKPLMVMETYTGWFDHWMEGHHTYDVKGTIATFTDVLDYPASMNMYMFVGGTNYHFMNGANTNSYGADNSGLMITTTSYDYDAPISESGNCSEKYYAIRNLILSHMSIDIQHPAVPEIIPPVAYPELLPEGQISFFDIIDSTDNKIHSKNILPMEELPINDNSGQSFGYVVYRKANVDINSNTILKISGYVRDTVLVLVDGILVSRIPETAADIDGFGFWRKLNSTILLNEKNNATIDLVVENFGRNNYGEQQKMIHQFKGLNEDVFLDEEKVENWQIIPLEFRKSWINKIKIWKTYMNNSGPSLYRFKLNLNTEPRDTFVDMRGWTKGIVIVNSFVLGRYFFLGPQQTLYLPAPFLNKGSNDIIILEHYKAADSLKFIDRPIFENASFL